MIGKSGKLFSQKNGSLSKNLVLKKSLSSVDPALLSYSKQIIVGPKK